MRPRDVPPVEPVLTGEQKKDHPAERDQDLSGADHALPSRFYVTQRRKKKRNVA